MRDGDVPGGKKYSISRESRQGGWASRRSREKGAPSAAVAVAVAAAAAAVEQRQKDRAQSTQATRLYTPSAFPLGTRARARAPPKTHTVSCLSHPHQLTRTRSAKGLDAGAPAE